MSDRLRFEDHLTEERLIRLLDGELNSNQRELVLRHLQSCWTCRRRQEQFRAAMDRFVEYEEALTDPSIVPPPGGWNSFRGHLQGLAAIGGSQTRTHAIPASLRSVFAPAVLAVAGLTVLWLVPARSVSANEVFARSASSEQQALL